MASVCDHRSSAHVWSSDMESDCPIVLREQMFEMPFHGAGSFTQMWPSGCVWNCMWEAEMKKLDSYTLRLYLHSRFHWCFEIETMTSWLVGQVDIPWKALSVYFVCWPQSFCYVLLCSWGRRVEKLKESIESLAATTQRGGKMPPNSLF